MPLAIKIILNYNFFVNKYLTFIEYVIIDNMKNEILEKINIKLEPINKKAYIVGGAVRDYLLNKKINDIDLVTNALISDLKSLFDGDFSFEKLGFCKIVVNNKYYDISTLRKEIYLNNFRHPEKIIFIDSLEEDSQRRDFTINSLYMDNDKIYDFHNGIKDLNDKIIRMIGNIDQRIKEDPLRMLRAIRFKLQLNFTIEKELDNYIKTHLYLLKEISRYQINKEIDKMKNISKEEFVNVCNEYKLNDYLVIDDYKRKYNIIDLHCDTITALYKQNKSLFRNDLHLDVQKLVKGQYLLQCFAIFLNKGETINDFNKYYEYYNQQLELNKIYLEKVLSYNDIFKIKSNNKIGAMLTLENGDIITNLDIIDYLYSLGIRMITLTWNYQNLISYSNKDENNGLTDFGKKVINKMNELGIIIDVSHLSDKGFYDVVEISKYPIVASHSNCRYICDNKRNLTDEMILLLHKNGGVMGMNYYKDFLTNQNVDTIQDIVNHIKHIKDLGCIDNIALGSDFDGIDTPNELSSCDKMNLLYECLIKNNFKENEIEKIFYKNIMRVFKKVLK